MNHHSGEKSKDYNINAKRTPKLFTYLNAFLVSGRKAHGVPLHTGTVSKFWVDSSFVEQKMGRSEEASDAE